MKKNKIIYWTSTSLAMLTGAFAGLLYLTGNPSITAAFTHLGFPDYFRIELGIAKIIGMIILLVPSVPAKIKEWAYAGFGITFLSAIAAHIRIDGVNAAIAPMIPLILLAVSYTYFHKLKAQGESRNINIQTTTI